MTAIMKKVGCIPSFWNGIYDYPGNIRPCKTATDYQNIYKYASNVALSRKLIMQPCEEMIVVTNIVKESGRRHEEKSLDRDTRKQTTYLDIAFVVGSEMFQEKSIWDSKRTLFEYQKEILDEWMILTLSGREKFVRREKLKKRKMEQFQKSCV